MAWSSPKTWSSGYVVLAADLNNIRDQLNATAPATLTAQGDIVIASGANALARLAKSTTSTQYLANTGSSNAPAWNEVALATGVSGTLPVGNGGTGQTSLTTGAILIGNSTSAVTMVTQTTKGQILIGDGSGPPQMLGVGTNDQVLTADSGETTGIKWGTPASTLATQAETEAASDGTKVASVSVMHYHPGVAKATVSITAAGIIESPDWNVASITDTGTGIRTIVIDNDMAGITYICNGSRVSSTFDEYEAFDTRAVGSVRHTIKGNSDQYIDIATMVSIFGLAD